MEEDKSWKGFNGLGLKMIRITSTHINVVTWVHRSARETGECSLICAPKEETGLVN